jgi:4-amino-4-deoxy-L-arabinose transferase-like glycosyltransferase
MTKLANSRWFWIVFAILTIAVYFSGLSVALVGPDEPRYAQVAREMFERGDWVTPTLGGFNWFEKPALLYWLQIASYHLFGVSEFAARFGSAIFGLATAACLWLLGRNGIGDKDFGNLLLVIGASTLGIIVFAHGASFDIIVTFPITAAMVAFFVYDRRESRPSANEAKDTPPLVLFYFFVGVALLAKGLIGIVLPYAIIGFYYLISWRLPSKKLLLSVLWGTALAVAVAAVWYVPMYLTHGYFFIDEFFIQHHFQRYTSNKYLHPQPFYFFFWVLPLMTLPWLPFFIGAIVKWIMDVFRRREIETADGNVDQEALNRLRLYALAWMLVPLLFFSFSGSKLPGYIVPAVPPAVVISGIFLARLITRNDIWRFPTQIIGLFMLLIVYISIGFALPSFADEDSVRSLIAAVDLRGYSQNKVIGYQFAPHSAEFYAPGRLFREPDGKQKFISDIASVNSVSAPGQPVLLLVPQNKLAEVQATESINKEVLGSNGRLYIVAVEPK